MKKKERTILAKTPESHKTTRQTVEVHNATSDEAKETKTTKYADLRPSSNYNSTFLKQIEFNRGHVELTRENRWKEEGPSATSVADEAKGDEKNDQTSSGWRSDGGKRA